MSRLGPSGYVEARSQVELGGRVPLIDVATDRCVGYLSSRYLNTRARLNLELFAEGKTWKILHITKDERVLALPKDGPKVLVNQEVDMRANIPLDPNSISDKAIILETAPRYIIIHTSFGGTLNRTLSLIFDAILTEQDLVQDAYSNNSGILFPTPARLTRDDADTLRRDLFEIHDFELDELIEIAQESRFPDFETPTGRNSSKTQTKAPARVGLSLGLEVKGAKMIFKAIAGGTIRIHTILSDRFPSPKASKIIEEYTQHVAMSQDLLAKSNYRKLKNAVENVRATLLCLNCLATQPTLQIEHLEEKPKCEHCGSGLLSVGDASDQTILNLIRRKKTGDRINTLEKTKLGQARRRGDLVLSYGKRAVIALSITGIGPQTASTILARMHKSEPSFYKDLLNAKIHYLTTRELWE